MARQADIRFNKRVYWLSIGLVVGLAGAAMIHVDALTVVGASSEAQSTAAASK